MSKAKKEDKDLKKMVEEIDYTAVIARLAGTRLQRSSRRPVRNSTRSMTQHIPI